MQYCIAVATCYHTNTMNEYIAIEPGVCHGKPCIRGTRILVSGILNMMAHGADIGEVLDAYPQLSREAVLAALAYAEALVEDEEILPVAV